jgi:hypothetical protein
MPNRAYYRFYCVSPRGGFIGVEEAHCDTDEDAQKTARERLQRRPNCRAIEVWRQDVMVCHIHRDEAA